MGCWSWAAPCRRWEVRQSQFLDFWPSGSGQGRCGVGRRRMRRVVVSAPFGVPPTPSPMETVPARRFACWQPPLPPSILSHAQSWDRGWGDTHSTPTFLSPSHHLHLPHSPHPKKNLTLPKNPHSPWLLFLANLRLLCLSSPPSSPSSSLPLSGGKKGHCAND